MKKFGGWMVVEWWINMLFISKMQIVMACMSNTQTSDNLSNLNNALFVDYFLIGINNLTWETISHQ